MIGKIVAIGGGGIGRPGTPVETTAIDREIIRLTGKHRPRLLFVPTASEDSEEYCETVHKHFGRRLGCLVDVLCLVRTKPRRIEISDKIRGADIIYVGGGDTLKMMAAWRRHGVDKLLKNAWKRGVVLSGLSAGALCWFRNGNSDSTRKKTGNRPLSKVSGLGLIGALFCPHFDSERRRQGSLKKMMKKTAGVALAVEDCCALEIVGGMFRVVSSRKGRNAYRTYWKNGRYFREPIEKSVSWSPLGQLLKK